MITLPALSYFASKEIDKYIFNKYTGSAGTSGKRGFLSKDTLSYLVYATKDETGSKPAGIKAECRIVTAWKNGGEKKELCEKQFDFSDEGLAAAEAWIDEIVSENIPEEDGNGDE